MPWLEDPATGKPSVSLTLLVLATVAMLVFIVLEAFEVLHSTALLDEFFLTSVGLYFGRRTSFNGKSLGDAIHASGDIIGTGAEVESSLQQPRSPTGLGGLGDHRVTPGD